MIEMARAGVALEIGERLLPVVGQADMSDVAVAQPRERGEVVGVAAVDHMPVRARVHAGAGDRPIGEGLEHQLDHVGLGVLGEHARCAGR
jgi:hypothetical protein